MTNNLEQNQLPLHQTRESANDKQLGIKNKLPLHRTREFATEKQLKIKTSFLYIGLESPRSRNNLEQKPVAYTSNLGFRDPQATRNKNQLPLHLTRESAIDKQHGTKTNSLYIGPGSPRSTSNSEQKPVASSSTSDLGVRDRQATWNKNQLPLHRTRESAINRKLRTKSSCLYIELGSS